jgi:hypothetical protein
MDRQVQKPEAGVLWWSTVKGYFAIFSTGTYRSKYKVVV